MSDTKIDNAARALAWYAPGAEGVTRILTDLRHWCEANHVDFHGAMQMSSVHFMDERWPQLPPTFHKGDLGGAFHFLKNNGEPRS